MINNNFLKKFFKFIILLLSLLVAMQLIACEDDAILEPELIKECKPGDSYCNLNLPNTENYAAINFINPEIF